MSSSATAPATLTANCSNCGGPVALTLAGPEPSCRFCSHTDPLEPAVRTKLASMRAKLGHRAAKQRQLTGQLVSTAGSASTGGVMVLVTCWLLFGGMAFGFAFFHDMDFWAFAAGPPESADLAGEWWMLFGLAVALPLSLGLWGLSLFRLRGLSAETLPLPPAYPGAPPRCRCCGAELPDGTALRRCRYCHADNLVAGQRYRRSELDLDRALVGIARTFERSLEGRVATANRAMYVAAFAPIVLLMVAPVGGIVSGVTLPALWPVAGACAVFGVVGLVLPLTRKLPKLEPLSCVAIGTELSVGGHRQQVNAQLLLPIQGQPRRVYSFLGDTPRSYERTMVVKPEPGGDPIMVHQLRDGGEPLTAEEQGSLEQVELWLPDGTIHEGVEVEHVHLLRQRKGGFRLWRQPDPPGPDTVPTWTATRMKDRPLIYFP